jgi:hypothetical protein
MPLATTATEDNLMFKVGIAMNRPKGRLSGAAKTPLGPDQVNVLLLLSTAK